MSNEAVKESRVVMRRVLEHLFESHAAQGVTRETVGFVEVAHHATSTLPALNYVTPRRSTAWVSGKHIESGLDVMRDQQRVPRVRYLDGLFPPIFGQSLAKLGLECEFELPVMAYRQQEMPAPALPEAVQAQHVTDHEGMATWWYVWRNAYYEVSTPGAEPLLLGRDMAALDGGTQMNLILYRYGFPVAVARLTRHADSAHLAAVAMMRELQTPELMRALHQSALHLAHEQGCDLVFAIAQDEAERSFYDGLGYEQFGHIVSYVEPRSDAEPEVQLNPTVVVV